MDLFGARQVPYIARRNYHYESRHLLGWGMLVGLLEGNFASVIVAKTFAGSHALIAIASTTPVAAHIASLLWGMLSVGRPKIRLLTICAAAAALTTGAVAALPPTQLGGWFFVLQMAAAQFFLTGVVTLRSALWKSNYPAASRARITARLQQVRLIVRMLAVAAVAASFDRNPESFRWIYPVVALIGLASTLVLRRMRIRGEKRELGIRAENGAARMALVEPFSLTAILSPGHVLSNAVRIVREDTRFRRYLVAQMFGGCANLLIRAVVVTVITVNLLTNVQSAYWISTILLDALTTLLTVGSMGRFAVYFDNVGVVRFRIMHGTLWTITLTFGLAGTLVVVFGDRIGPSHLPLGVVVFALFAAARGLCMGAGNLAWNLGHLHFAKPQDAEVYMGIHVSLTGLRGIILPGVGMLIWQLAGWMVWVIAILFSLVALSFFVWIDRDETDLQESLA